MGEALGRVQLIHGKLVLGNVSFQLEIPNVHHGLLVSFNHQNRIQPGRWPN